MMNNNISFFENRLFDLRDLHYVLRLVLSDISNEGYTDCAANALWTVMNNLSHTTGELQILFDCLQKGTQIED